MSIQLYKKHSGQMRSCDLIEWQSHTALGWAIRLFSRKQVNHSSILLRLDRAGLADRRFVLEALEGGMELRLMSERLAEYKGKVWWHALRGKLVSKDTRATMIDWAILQTAMGKKYDYGSLLRNMFGRVSVDGANWFCSEAYTGMLQIGNLYTKTGKALRPGEFDRLKLHIPPVLIFDSTKEVTDG
jgi:hypothetical protein